MIAEQKSIHGIIEQERAEFEAWHAENYAGGDWSLDRDPAEPDEYVDLRLVDGWEAWKARAALQSQDAEDVERLDWLEDQAQTSRTGVSIDYVYDAQDGYVNEKGYRFMRHRFIGPLGKTAREAIDHARRIES